MAERVPHSDYVNGACHWLPLWLSVPGKRVTLLTRRVKQSYNSRKIQTMTIKIVKNTSPFNILSFEKSVTSRNFLKSVENYHKTEGDSVPLLCKHPTADSMGHVIPPGGNRALPSECRQLGLASCNIGLSRTESLIIYCQKIISAVQKFVFMPKSYVNQWFTTTTYILSGPSLEAHKSLAWSCVVVEAKAGSSTGSRTTEELGWESQIKKMRFKFFPEC